jgi:23S rRNA (cytosine1962-C5)-methyltransferase
LHYHRSKTGGGAWEIKKPAPSSWLMHWGGLTFSVRPTDFKHMGLFPEQAANWRWMQSVIRKARKPVRLLNLFGYTGAATAAAAAAGAHVTHVDAAKGMNQWAKENAALSGAAEQSLRFIAEDALKFVKRESRRGQRYDAVVMDPPSYGRGPSGEIWKIEDRLYSLVRACTDILSDQPLFFLINAYTTGFSPVTAANILRVLMREKYGARQNDPVTCGELCIPCSNGLNLPCGIYARWDGGNGYA